MILIKRLSFARKRLTIIEEDDNLLDKIIWTDEAIFELNDHVSRHNSFYEASEILELILKDLNVPRICVWIGISSYSTMAPFSFTSTVTRENYFLGDE